MNVVGCLLPGVVAINGPATLDDDTVVDLGSDEYGTFMTPDELGQGTPFDVGEGTPYVFPVDLNAHLQRAWYVAGFKTIDVAGTLSISDPESAGVHILAVGLPETLPAINAPFHVSLDGEPTPGTWAQFFGFTAAPDRGVFFREQPYLGCNQIGNAGQTNEIDWQMAANHDDWTTIGTFDSGLDVDVYNNIGDAYPGEGTADVNVKVEAQFYGNSASVVNDDDGYYLIFTGRIRFTFFVPGLGPMQRYQYSGGHTDSLGNHPPCDEDSNTDPTCGAIEISTDKTGTDVDGPAMSTPLETGTLTFDGEIVTGSLSVYVDAAQTIAEDLVITLETEQTRTDP